MLAKRIISVLTINDGVLYRTKLFKPDYRYTANFVDSWSIDEIIILDITRNREIKQKRIFYRFLEKFSENCFVPLTVGGWIKSIHDVRDLMKIGADKVSVNTEAYESPNLLTTISEKYGTQALVISVDTKLVNKKYKVVINQGKTLTNKNPFEWAKLCEKKGAGEILINSVEKDGWLQGYDLNLLRKVKLEVNIPVIGLGGCGNWQHMYEAFDSAKIDAVATQNIFHFTEQSIKSAKSFLKGKNIVIRDC